MYLDGDRLCGVPEIWKKLFRQFTLLRPLTSKIKRVYARFL